MLNSICCRIDYDKFHELANGDTPFSPMEYTMETPEWAVVGAPERGFDPVEVRHLRKQKAEQQA